MSFNSFSSSVKLNNIKTYNKANTTSDAFKNTFYEDIKDIDYSQYEEADYNLLDLEKEIETEQNDKKWYEEVIELDKKMRATQCVVTTTVVSGGLKIAEYAADGLTWLGGMATSGIVRLFGDEELAKSIEEATMDEIARDKVGELNEQFYEGTKLGRSINEASAMKYDSDAAKKIQNITTDVVVIAGATAATVVTGGAATPLFVTGFVIGAGESAEKNFQDKENRDFWKDSVEIGVDGTIKGFSTVAYGKAGSMAVNGVKTISSFGFTGTKELVKTSVKGITKDAVKETIKNNGKTILKNTATQTLKDKDTWLETGAVLADDIKSGIQTGEWNALAMLGDAALIYGENYVGNLGGSIVGDVLGNSTDNLNNDNRKSSKRQKRIELEAEYDLNLEKKIFSRMPKKLNDLEQSKYIYNKLNEEMIYSSRYFYGDSTTRNIIYNQNIDINNLTNKEIVCSNWSEIYCKLLNKSGIEAKVMGNSHKWVTFELSDGTKWLADATQPYNGLTDLTNAKTGTTSGGFVRITDEMYNSNDLVQGRDKVAAFKIWIESDSFNSKKNIMDVDKNIGYDYDSVNNLFSNLKTSSNEILNANMNSTFGEITAMKLEKLIFPQMEKLDIMEGTGYYATMKNVLNSNEKNLITHHTLQKSDGSWYTTFKLDLQNGYTAEYIYDGKGNITKDLIKNLE